MKQKIIAIYRSQQHSPNLLSADARIMNNVVDALKENYEIVSVTEEEFIERDVTADIIINMCRTEEALNKMQHIANSGVLVINSPQSIANCSRRKLYKLFTENRIPIPPTQIVKTAIDSCEVEISFPCWIKLPDAPTTKEEDICYITTHEELSVALRQFNERGEEEVLLSQHLSGDLVKFYSVEGSQFIHTTYPTIEQHSKFGYEYHNDEIKSIPFDRETLLQISQRAAEVTGVKIFGGDCIITPSGEPYIIDFNDWPSFSPCAEEASKEIVEMIKKETIKWNKKR